MNTPSRPIVAYLARAAVVVVLVLTLAAVGAQLWPEVAR